MSYKRKYKIGDKVESLDELTQQNYVYIYNHPKAIRHISVIESMTFRTVMRFLSMGMYKAVRVEDGETKEFAFCEAVKQERYIPHTSTIPEWCPLVEVPDGHGRLIDADELLPIYADLMDGGDVKPVIPKAVIDVAPTIIGEDNGQTELGEIINEN